MKRVVLDASAVMTFFENRPGADKVEELIHLGVAGKRQLLMSVVNWGEVYYSTWRAHGPGVARKIIEDVSQLPIEIVDATLDLTGRRRTPRQPQTPLFRLLRRRPRRPPQSLPRDKQPRLRHRRKKIDILWTIP